MVTEKGTKGSSIGRLRRSTTTPHLSNKNEGNRSALGFFANGTRTRRDSGEATSGTYELEGMMLA